MNESKQIPVLNYGVGWNMSDKCERLTIFCLKYNRTIFEELLINKRSYAEFFVKKRMTKTLVLEGSMEYYFWNY